MKKKQPKITPPAAAPDTATQPPAAAPALAVQPAAPAVPDWVTKTPRDFDYDLMLYDEYDGERQHIALTRAEYIAVKGYLAGMRGLVPVPAPAAPNDNPDVIRQSELQSVFDDLGIVNLKILGYRRRILAGATVEPGPLAAEWEDQDGPGPELPWDDGWFSFSAYGLKICSAEDSEVVLKARYPEAVKPTAAA